MPANSSRGFITAFAATLLWSATGPLISYLVTAYALPPLIIAFWRNFFVTVCVWIGLWFFNRTALTLDRRFWKFIFWYGLTLALFNALWIFSIQYNGATVATVLSFSSPMMTAALSRIFFKERFNTLKIISILICFVGIVLVADAANPAVWKLNSLGIICGVLTGLMFAVYSLQGKVSADLQVPPWSALFYSFVVASVFLFFFDVANDLWIARQSIVSNLFWLGNSLSGWGWLFLLGVIPTLGGFVFYNESIRHLSPTAANLIVTLEPVFTAILAYFFLNELMNRTQFVGSGLLLVGIVLLRAAD